MKSSKIIVVFGGIRCADNGKKYYYKLAYKTGRLLAENNFIVATGAGPGLMDMTLKGAREAGGKTIGVALDIKKRKQSENAKTLYTFKDLETRQKRLIKIGDAFIVLPGGVGTLNETFDIFAQKKVRKIDPWKPVILVDKYYKLIDAFLNKISILGFTNIPLNNFYNYVQRPEDSIEIIKKYLAQKRIISKRFSDFTNKPEAHKYKQKTACSRGV